MPVFEYTKPFYLFAGLPLLALLLWVYWQWRERALAELGEVKRLMPPFSKRLFWLKNGLIAGALIFLALAWANPRLGTKKQTVTQESADVFIALDISQSMLCEDVAPSRLDLAKSFLQKLVKALEGERIGLIFFAGDAFVQMPLSTDYAFVLQSIASASPELISAQGTALAPVIELASKSYDPEPGGGRALILVTDGEDHDEDAVARAETAFDDGIVLYTVGAGTAAGGPIPTGAAVEVARYKRDDNGTVVISRLNEGLLQQLAQAGGGKAFNLRQSDAAIRLLQREIGGLQKRQLEVRSFAEFESWYQLFLLPALLLLVLEAWLSPVRKAKQK